MTRQDKHLIDDLRRSRARDSMPQSELDRQRQLQADYRLAENSDTARLLVRERHGLLTGNEALRLGRLRAALIRIAELVEAGML